MCTSFALSTQKWFHGSLIRAERQLTHTECFPHNKMLSPKQENSNPTGKKQSNRHDAGHHIVYAIGWHSGYAIRLWLWHDAGHQSDVDVVQWHPNSHYVTTGSSDRSIRLWDIRDASTARVFVGHRSPVSQPATLSLMQTTCRNAMCNVHLGPSVTCVSRHHDKDGVGLASHAALCRQACCTGLASCLQGQTMHSVGSSLWPTSTARPVLVSFLTCLFT